MKKLAAYIEEYLLPFSQKVSSNKYLVAVRDGLMLSMPLLIVGSLGIIIGDFPVPAYQRFMTGLLGDAWTDWCWGVMIPATISLVALLAVVGISHSLASENKVEPMPAVAIAVSAYFLILLQTEGGGFASDDFAAKGLFAAMIVSLISTSIYSYVIKRNWVIKLPESVPSFVSRQFTALIPAAIILPLFLVVRYVFAATPYDTVSNFVVQVLQIPLINIGTSLPGTLVSSFFNSLLWFFGIHGTAVVQSIMNPLWFAAQFQNLDVYNANPNALRPFIATASYTDMFIFLTGTGNTLPLAILMVFKCKSSRIRSIGKIGLVPGIFNVNEPITFGLPIVLNPIMAIPFFIVPTVTVLISYLAMHSGLVPYPTGVTIPWTTPAPIGGWLLCNSWTGGFLQLVVLLVAGLIYYPFIMTLDKQYLREEHTELQPTS